jgi:short-subunit dehydrogenase
VDINDAGSQETLGMVRKAGGTGEMFHADVSSPRDVKSMADHFFGSWGGVDLMVNNAGVYVYGPAWETPMKNWERTFAVNFWGVLHGCLEFIPRMKAQGGGHIVNVASTAGLLSIAGQATYNATKAAVVSLSETLRVESAPYDIGITVVCPTFFDTNLLETAGLDGADTELVETFFKCSRISPDEVARRALKAVRKNRLYAVPQISAKIYWLDQRLSPETFYRIFCFLNKNGWMRPLLMQFARRGMI